MVSALMKMSLTEIDIIFCVTVTLPQCVFSLLVMDNGYLLKQMRRVFTKSDVSLSLGLSLKACSVHTAWQAFYSYIMLTIALLVTCVLCGIVVSVFYVVVCFKSHSRHIMDVWGITHHSMSLSYLACTVLLFPCLCYMLSLRGIALWGSAWWWI